MDPAQNLSISIFHDTYRSNASFEQIAEGHRNGLREELIDFEQYESGRMTLSGAEAEWTVYSYAIQDVRLQALHYIAVRDGHSWSLTCATSPETFSARREQFEKIVRSFRFE